MVSDAGDAKPFAGFRHGAEAEAARQLDDAGTDLDEGRHNKLEKAGSELRQGDPLSVAGVLGLAPAPELDLLHERGACGGAIDALMGGSPRAQPQRYAAAMPSRLAPNGVAPNGVAPNDVRRIGVPQTLVIGAQDADWRWVGEAYARRARAAGDTRIEVVVVPAAGHFEVIDPRTTAWPAVLRAARELLHRIRAGN